MQNKSQSIYIIANVLFEVKGFHDAEKNNKQQYNGFDASLLVQ